MNLILIFIIGAFGYAALETVWRGTSHWTMMICGGISLLAIYFVHSFKGSVPCIYLYTACTLIITAIEFIAGCIINLKFKMNVWDYSGMLFNFKGQICLAYSLGWFALSIVMFKFCDYFPLK